MVFAGLVQAQEAVWGLYSTVERDSLGLELSLFADSTFLLTQSSLISHFSSLPSDTLDLGHYSISNDTLVTNDTLRKYNHYLFIDASTIVPVVSGKIRVDIILKLRYRFNELGIKQSMAGE